jgi:hypothetical protein
MPQSYKLTDVDQTLLEQFQTCALPFELWTHRAHVRVAYLYLRLYAFDEALTRMRAGIKAYNAFNKRLDGPTTGYNETTTHAFLHLVAAVMLAYDQCLPVTDSESFCDMHPQFMSKHALRFFYSPERRMLPAAKTLFVEPDLAPLPKFPKL